MKTGGVQTEQVLRQQSEYRRLAEENTGLKREAKVLGDRLRDEQDRVREVWEDAERVREEISREMGEYEVVREELRRIKGVNERLRRKLVGESMEQQTQEDADEGERSRVEKVSVGISRADSLLSLDENFNAKIEEVIEEKTRSIVNLLT